jgi:hypothetical protein
MKMRAPTMILGLLTLSACAGVRAPEEETPNEPAATAEPAAAAPTSTPVAGPTTAPATEGPTSPLHVIARSDVGLALHRLVDDGLVVAAGPLVMRVDAAGEVVYDPSMLRGIVPIRDASIRDDEGSFYGVEAWSPIGLGGRWPDALYLSLDFTSGFRGEGGQPITYRHTPEGWKRLEVGGTLHEHHLLELRPWKDGSVLARRGHVMKFPGQEKWDGEDGPTRQQLATAERAIEKSKKLVVVRGAPKAPDVGPSLSGFDARPSGEVFAVIGTSKQSMLRIAADGTRTEIDLPSQAAEVRGVVAEGSDRVWAFGMGESTANDDDRRPWFVVVEGGTAADGGAPPCAKPAIMSLSITHDGTQWVTCGSPYEFEASEASLWTRAPGEAWSQVSLPHGVVSAEQVIARAPDDVWVTGKAADGHVLMHTRPRTSVLEVPGLARIGRMVHEWNDLVPIGKYCVHGYVPLTIDPSEAASVKAKLDADLVGFSTRVTVGLVRTSIRGQQALGLQLGGDSESTVADAAALRKIAVRRLGDSAVGAPRCWEADVADDGILGSWQRP